MNNMLTRITQPLFYWMQNKNRYDIVPVNSDTTDVKIVHTTGTVIQIETDGSVIVSAPNNLTLHAVGDLQIASDTHIGLTAPRIDLN
jgi:hypothetical protein